MKTCKMCARVLPLTEFFKKFSDGEAWNSYCKPCQREYCRGHYERNKGKHNPRRRENLKRYINKNKIRLLQYLFDKACVDCGLIDPEVMEFDHVRGEKSDNVSTLLHTGKSWKRILEEIWKCDVRCANCHRRKTIRQLKWFRGNFGV